MIENLKRLAALGATAGYFVRGMGTFRENKKSEKKKTASEKEKGRKTRTFLQMHCPLRAIFSYSLSVSPSGKMLLGGMNKHLRDRRANQ